MIRRFYTGAICLLVLCFIVALTPEKAGADAALGTGLKPDVRILIDISGSMKESDPDNLRAPALDLLVRLLPQGSRAGVWIFGEAVEQLVPHGAVDEQWRQQAQKAMSQIDNSGQRTNIPAALEAATYDLKRMDPGYRTSIVLLTDGKVDIAQSPMVNASAARKLLAGAAPELGATGIPVHTIALSDNADRVFLRSLSESSGGVAEKAESAGELTEVFLQSLEMVAPTARVPVSDHGFQIDDSVEEFTALIFFKEKSKAVSLDSPSGISYSPESPTGNVDWFANKQFALVTVKSPETGAWKLRAPKDASTRVTVISDLQLEVDPLPNSLPAGRNAELGLRLRERGKVLNDQQLLSVFSIEVEVRGEGEKPLVLDVSGNYQAPDDGEYRVTMPAFERPGRYTVVVRLETQTLQRELPMIVEVYATPAKATLVTKGQDIPEDDLQAPLTGLALALAFLGLIAWLILRRRKKRKLEIWNRRSRQMDAPLAESELVEGVSVDHSKSE